MGGTTQFDRKLGATVIVAFTLCSPGCMTPLAIGRDRIGIGFFRQTSVPEVAGVRSSSTEGVGLLFRSDGVSLGYISIEEIVIDPEAAPDGVLISTSRLSVATGPKAEAVALSEAAVSDYLVYPISLRFLGVIP